MSEKAKREYFRSKGLLPWQVNLALSILESKEKRYWELVAPIGAGKTHLAAALIAHELEDGLNKRILVLAPAQTLLQWQFELLSFWSLTTAPVLTPLIVDRKTYLELESHVPIDQSPWPLPAIILMSIDLAKREDMVGKLSSVNWDLVIFDESHRLIGMRKALFDRLTESGIINRTLLLAPAEHPLLNDRVTTIRITYKDIVDWNGRPLFGPFEKELITVYYRRTEEERAFLNELQEFVRRLADKWFLGKSRGKFILRVASSSIYATEEVLLRLKDVWKPMRNKIAHGVPWTDEDAERVQRQLNMAADEPEVIDELLGVIAIQPHEFLAFYQKLESLLDQIDQIPTDPKLDTLIYYVRKFCETKDRPYICIVSSFVNTVHYINSSVQEIGIPVYSLTSSLEFVKRMDLIKAFRENGGILVATDAGLEGVGLENVDECINYDLPPNKQMFAQRWGRFVRFGRKGKFKMVVFRDQTEALSWEEDFFKALEKRVSSEKES